ncbi:uncharacterized protein LOC135387668 [Ornithodoros turicata]|uniref:uncharacterized protein LOC135387668 n=1 Tax=Ornithodoros turicata TaxID=34597 RepID=UPI0031388E0A
MASILEDVVLLDSLSWEEIEDALLHESLDGCHKRSNSDASHSQIWGLDEERAKLEFRFEKKDIAAIRIALRIPDKMRTQHGVTLTGEEALCVTLRRLAYPNRLCGLELLFGHHPSTLSLISNAVVTHIDSTFGHLLLSETLTPLTNCWGLIDGTARAICRPSEDQKIYFSGHKRYHALKYQSVMCPNGLIVRLDGPYEGRKHDAGILRASGLYGDLEKLMDRMEGHYVLYGDPAYPLLPLLQRPYVSASVSPQQKDFNKAMSTVRQCVEWGFGKIIAEFAFLDFKKNQKLRLHQVAKMYKAATILCNCHTCLYGSQTTQYFGVAPPTLEECLVPRQ